MRVRPHPAGERAPGEQARQQKKQGHYKTGDASEVFRAGAGRLGGSVKLHNLGSLILYKRLGWNVEKTGPDRVDVWVDREE